MKQGALIFDEYRDLYEIRFDLKDYLGGFYIPEISLKSLPMESGSPPR